MMTSRRQSLSYSFQALVTAAALDVSPKRKRTLGDRFPAFASNAAVLLVIVVLF